MTKSEPHGRCSWCRRPIQAVGRGRPRKYCRQGHRQRAYEARVLADRLGVGAGEALVPAEPLRRLGDLLYALEAAVEDVERDLEADPDGHTAALEHLYAAANALRGVTLDPVAVGEE